MTEFLTKDEIEELTGRKLLSLQIAWLEKKGWIFETNAAGRPIISREYTRAKLGGHPVAQPAPGKQPNFAALL